jgi:pyruvate/2-oxoglutarate dehydrogenase complex dihydrolipoamide dehydrogenase (E3) component
VALIEKHRLGGDCLNTGCVPSKALLRSARAAAEARRAAEFGVRCGPVEVDGTAVQQRMRRLRAGISHHDSAQRFRSLGVDVFLGQGRFTGPSTMEVGGQSLEFARAVIATGARPARPDVPGLDPARVLTSDTVWDLGELPRRLIVLGGGPIGCELAQAFRRLGSDVFLVQRGPTLLPRDEPEAQIILRERFRSEGIHLHFNARPILAAENSRGLRLQIQIEGRTEWLEADAVLAGIGRTANVEGLGLEAADVAFDAGGVKVDDFLRTTNPHIYAAGDVCSPYQFTHAADAQARVVIQNALFFGWQRVSRLVIPWCTYTDPEVAHVGLTLRQAEQRGIAVRTFRVGLEDVDRAVLDGEAEGIAIVHVRPGTDRILGATVVASHAGDILGELTLAMTTNRGLEDIAHTIHTYPTQGEVVRKLADAFQRGRLTPTVAKLLHWVCKWRR